MNQKILALVLLGAAASSTAPPRPVPVTVDVGRNRRAIDPRIYGLASADEASLRALRSPLNLLGGVGSSRYNWKIDAGNSGAADSFRSVPLSPTGIPGQWADLFIGRTRAADAVPMVTLPMLEWVARLGPDRAALEGRAGKGAYDPGAASVPAGVDFQGQFVRHLIRRWGPAAPGHLRYYVLDHEPSLWPAAHGDVHPNGPSREEIRDKIVAYAARVRALDPAARIVGPEERTFGAPSLSGQDGHSPGCDSAHLDACPDRASHGGTDYLPWLLQSLRQHEAETGSRVLDVFSVHCSPLPPEEYGDDASAATQLWRNRATRVFWDPTYVDESSGEGGRGGLIPQLRDWVGSHYPGLDVGLTEYDLGADRSMGGATAQADALGIFGREGLDLAVRSRTPGAGTPAYDAIRMYRNYDGQGSAFGETSVLADTPDPDALAVFAAERSRDEALTVMVVNKALTPARPDIELSGFSPTGPAEVWQLAGGPIERRADTAVTNGRVTLAMPAQSITLLVVPTRRSLAAGTTTSGRTAAAVTTTPTLAFSAAQYRTREGGKAVITVRRSGALAPSLTVGYAALQGTATLGDFSLVSGTLSFPSGVASRTFQVPTIADSLAEGPETVVLLLSGATPAGSLGSPSSAVLLIDDDDKGGAIQFSSATATVAEGATASVKVVRSGGLASGASVSYAATGGTASNGSDYMLSAGNLVFAAGQTAATFALPASADSLVEGDETVVLTLGGPAGGATLGTRSSMTVTIADHDKALFFASPAVRVAESARVANITVRRSGDLSLPASVDYATGGGTATPGQDYETLSGTLSFPARVATRTFAVRLKADALAEGDETVGLALTNPLGAALAPGAGAFLTIVDDDLAGTLQFASPGVVVSEALRAVNLLVTRSGGKAAGVSVDYAVTGGSATGNADYALPPGSLSFAAGVTSRTLAVPLLGDAVVESPETVVVTLSNPTGGAALGAVTSSTVTLVDNDGGAPGVSWAASSVEVHEPAGAAPGFVSLGVRRTGRLTGTSSVQVSTGDGSATAGSDYTPQTGVLVTFAPGQTSALLRIPILPDSLDEPTESFAATLSAPAGAEIVGPPSAPVRILDGDVAGVVQLAASDASGREGQSASVTVVRTGGLAGAVSVAYQTIPDSATSDDFTATSGSLVFGPGEKSKTVLVPLTADDTDEGVESFRFALRAPGGGATLGTPSAGTVWIVEAGGPPGGAVSTWSTKIPGGGTQAMSGGVSNGALGDKSPAGRPDTIVFAVGEASGTGSLYLHYGQLLKGATTRLQVWDGSTNESLYDATAVQDTVNYDFHIVSGTNPGQQLHYWRYSPTRNPTPGADQGRITGWTQKAHIVLPTSFATAVAPSIIEVTDGRGKKRLLVFGQTGNYGGATRLVLFTTAPGPTSDPAYGVTPASAADFVGAQGEASATLVATHPGYDFWSTALFVEQHRVSRVIECFAMSGTHGDQGEHSRTPLKVSTSNPSYWVLGASEWYSKLGGAWKGTAGGFGAVAPDDSIWWTWSGANSQQHFSRVDGAGVVTHDVIPSPGETDLAFGAGQFPFMNHMAISSAGFVASLVTTASEPYRVVLRVHNGYTWTETEVTTLADYNIQGCGFRGTTIIDGVEWMALFVAQVSPAQGVLAGATFPH